MNDSIFSPYWYRVSSLRPRWAAHIESHRHHYRGKRWYVLENRLTNRTCRLRPHAYRLICLLDGERTVADAWEAISEDLGEEAPTQTELIELLSRLHREGVLVSPSSDTARMLEIHEEERRRARAQKLLSPLFWRLPVADPERWLARLEPLARRIFSRCAMLAWFVVVAVACALAAVHWKDLSHDVIDRVLAPSNLLVLVLLFPLMKIIHELGHALAVKAFGGRVHDVGVYFLVFTPLPYVDASAASAFPEKGRRIVVSAAGMMAELFVASIALFLWLAMDAGATRAVVFNILVLASVSTLLFNGNPLLRFDGYYMLCDAIGIPSLSTRASQYLRYLRDRHLLGSRSCRPPIEVHGERFWLASYGIASFCYRVLVVAVILLVVATRFFFVGVVLAVWALIGWLVIPVAKLVRHVLVGPELADSRRRAVGVSVAIVAGCILLVCAVPLPLRTVVQGVVWVPRDAIVRAESGGFVLRLATAPHSEVSRGDELFVCDDPEARVRVQVLEAEIEELEKRRETFWHVDPVKTEMLADGLRRSREQLEEERRRVAALTVKSPVDGVFVVPRPEDLPGRFVRQGDVLGYVLPKRSGVARVVVPQESIELVRHRTDGVTLRFVEDMDEVVETRVRRSRPRASNELASRALGTSGGGSIVVDPSDESGTTAVEKLFHIDLEIDHRPGRAGFGTRVYARFDHGWEPLGSRWYRALRRLFLSRFEV